MDRPLVAGGEDDENAEAIIPDFLLDGMRPAFEELSDDQWEQVGMLGELLTEWNGRVNLISRKDIANVLPRHVIPCLAMAKALNLQDGVDGERWKGGVWPRSAANVDRCAAARVSLSLSLSLSPPTGRFYYFILFLSHPIYYLRPSSSLSPSNSFTQIRGHIAGSSPPFPLRSYDRAYPPPWVRNATSVFLQHPPTRSPTTLRASQFLGNLLNMKMEELKQWF